MHRNPEVRDSAVRSNCGAISISADSSATHTGKRAQCLRFVSVTPERERGHEIAALLRCFGGGEQTGPVAGLLSDGECPVVMGYEKEQCNKPFLISGLHGKPETHHRPPSSICPAPLPRYALAINYPQISGSR